MVQYAARVISLTLFVSGLVHSGSGLVGVLFVTAALAIIGLLPPPPRPQDAHSPDRLPAVLGPDLLGHALTGFFIALPFWAGG